MDADKTSKALGSETKVFMPHSTADEHQHVDISCPWHPKSHKGEMEGQMDSCTHGGLHYRKGTESEEPAVLLQAVSKSVLYPGKSPSRLLRAKTRLRNGPGKEQSGPSVLRNM